MCAFVRLRCGVARARDGAAIRLGLTSRSAPSAQHHHRHRLEPWPARAAGPCGACRARSHGRFSTREMHGLRVLRTCVSKRMVRRWICALMSTVVPTASHAVRVQRLHRQARSEQGHEEAGTLGSRLRSQPMHPVRKIKKTRAGPPRAAYRARRDCCRALSR